MESFIEVEKLYWIHVVLCKKFQFQMIFLTWSKTSQLWPLSQLWSLLIFSTSVWSFSLRIELSNLYFPNSKFPSSPFTKCLFLLHIGYLGVNLGWKIFTREKTDRHDTAQWNHFGVAFRYCFHSLSFDISQKKSQSMGSWRDKKIINTWCSRWT